VKHGYLVAYCSAALYNIFLGSKMIDFSQHEEDIGEKQWRFFNIYDKGDNIWIQVGESDCELDELAIAVILYYNLSHINIGKKTDTTPQSSNLYNYL